MFIAIGVANREERNYFFFMVVEPIREFLKAVPFHPFELHLTDGRKFRVPHPDFVTVSPKGSTVIVFDENEHPHHISSLLIVSANPARNRRSKTKRTR